MIESIEQAASSVGINTFITNSNERIEAQLNRIARIEDMPIMLVSWDLQTTLDFDDSGFLKNPSTSVVALLVTKAEDTTHAEFKRSAEEMGVLFTSFVNNLNDTLRTYQRSGDNAISGAGYTLVPRHGGGAHSGVLGRFTMQTEIVLCDECEDCADCDK